MLSLGNLSLRKSASQILSKEVNSSSLTAVHGIRVLSMCWIVLGHQYVTTLIDVNVNNINILDVSVLSKSHSDITSLKVKNKKYYVFHTMQWITSWNSLYIFVAPFAVDTFFTLSGLLITYLFLKEMAEGKKFNIFTFYLHRYIRYINHSEPVRTIPIHSDICIRANANHSEPIRKTFCIWFDKKRSKINLA